MPNRHRSEPASRAVVRTVINWRASSTLVIGCAVSFMLGVTTACAVIIGAVAR